MTEHSCKTCLYGLKAEDGKTACTYSGICHSPEGEKTAYRPNKALQYAEVVGRKFRPTFDSPIDYFTIRGYDEERDMVLTTAHPKEGSPFDDEIEERYLMGAFETGEYEAVNENPWPSEETMHIIANPYYDMMGPMNPREQKFCGPCCDRCQHRFGTTSNRDWCSDHWRNEKCYRFKLES